MENAFAESVDESLVPRETRIASDLTETPVISSEPENPQFITRNLFDGSMRQLDVMGKNGSVHDPIPGYRLYWFSDKNDTGIRPKQAQMSGWEFVTQDEVVVSENLVGNTDLGSKVSKIVDPNAVPPVRGYLMKIPSALFDRYQAEREERHKTYEMAMRAGTLGRRPQDRQYSASDLPGKTALPDIEISTSINRSRGGSNG